MPHTTTPASPKQLAANRANAAKSTGPRTPEGKARAAQNARKHGFTASTFAVVRLEDLEEAAHLKDDLVTLYQPVNSQELFAVERIALAQQALLRAARLESGLFTTCLNEACDFLGKPLVLMNEQLTGGDIEITREQNRNYLLAEGFHRMARNSGSWSLFLRYQAQAERHYRRAVEEFERLKALREELPNEELPNKPNLDPQPEQNEPVCAPAETNPSPPETPPSGDSRQSPPPEPESCTRLALLSTPVPPIASRPIDAEGQPASLARFRETQNTPVHHALSPTRLATPADAGGNGRPRPSGPSISSACSICARQPVGVLHITLESQPRPLLAVHDGIRRVPRQVLDGRRSVDQSAGICGKGISQGGHVLEGRVQDAPDRVCVAEGSIMEIDDHRIACAPARIHCKPAPAFALGGRDFPGTWNQPRGNTRKRTHCARDACH